MVNYQVQVVAGDHVVAATFGAVAVIAHREPGPITRDSVAVRALSALHGLIGRAAEKGGERFGRTLGRLIVKWVADQPDDVEFGVLSPADEGFAIFLKGSVLALIEHDGECTTVRGTDSATFSDRIMAINQRAALLVIEDGLASDLPPERGFTSLNEGTAQGAGAVIWLSDVIAAAPAAPSDSGLIKVGDPDQHVELKEPKNSVVIRPTDDPPARRDPLPIPGPAGKKGSSTAEKSSGRKRSKTSLRHPIRGIQCRQGDLNDPRAAFCRVCGRRLNETKVIVEGERPPLGFLVLDDGTVFVVDGDYVIGREPEKSPSAQAGAKPIRLQDAAGRLSRAHAEFRSVEWDVAIVDLGAKNGTKVKPPGQRAWNRLAPNQPYLLMGGTEITLGGRQLTFEASHAHL